MSKRPHFVVTGGAGFIGSNLVKALSERYPDHGIVVIDDMSHADPDNLAGFEGRIIDEPVNTESPLEQLPVYDNICAIFHMAAISNNASEDSDQIDEINIRATQQLMIAAQAMNVPFIYASSAGVYGNGPVPMAEGQELQPTSVYAESKIQCDAMANLFSPGGILYMPYCSPVVGLRYFNVYGPGENHKQDSNSCSAALHFFRQLSKGPGVMLYRGSHGFLRDFIYIDDAVDATIRAYESGVTGIFNVGTGESSSFLGVLAQVERAMGVVCRICWADMPVPMMSRYQYNTQADTRKSRRILGYSPRLDLRTGVEKYVKYLSGGN